MEKFSLFASANRILTGIIQRKILKFFYPSEILRHQKVFWRDFESLPTMKFQSNFSLEVFGILASEIFSLNFPTSELRDFQYYICTMQYQYIHNLRTFFRFAEYLLRDENFEKDWFGFLNCSAPNEWNELKYIIFSNFSTQLISRIYNN